MSIVLALFFITYLRFHSIRMCGGVLLCTSIFIKMQCILYTLETLKLVFMKYQNADRNSFIWLVRISLSIVFIRFHFFDSRWGCIILENIGSKVMKKMLKTHRDREQGEENATTCIRCSFRMVNPRCTSNCKPNMHSTEFCYLNANKRKKEKEKENKCH